MTRLRNVGLLAGPAAPAPVPQDAATVYAALREVWDGHLYLDFDWYGWRERARTALGISVSAAVEAPPEEPT
jgi:hypothetical protein